MPMSSRPEEALRAVVVVGMVPVVVLLETGFIPPFLVTFVASVTVAMAH
jgi:hypothetical protein